MIFLPGLLKERVAIITGGSEGIGKAAAHRMADEGARVVIVARRPDVLKAAAEEIQAATKGVVLPLQGDVIEPATIDRVVKTTLDNFGRIDILVNNAGVSMAKPFEAVSDDDWESDFGLSAGLDAYLVGGFGFRAAYDYVNRDGGSPGVFSLGVNYNFGTPGL